MAIEFAKSQRATANEPAYILWQWLRNRQVGRQKFRREYPIPPYTADFCCVELKLILECDGEEHFTPAGQERDRVRDEHLSSLGYRVIRIPGFDVLRAGYEVLSMISSQVQQRMEELGKDKGKS